jgi:hypothetical protein
MEPRTGQVQRTGWVGWIYFAGFMLIIAGIIDIFYGLVAIFDDKWVVWGNRGSVFLDVTQWGWVHLVIGILVVLVGVGVLTGNLAARIVASILVAISLIVNFMGIPLYPLWAIVLIAIDALVLWALVGHGEEVRA